MIIGLGNDLVDIRRIEDSLERFGQRFIDKVFTVAEQATADRRVGQARAGAYAKRFAAKEALVKALGKQGVGWRDMEVTNDAEGKPHLSLSGGAAELLARRIPAGMTAHLHLSLSDDYPLAQAVLIIEALPA
ncbi:Holo- acyl-carrier protein synthase [Paramagnetospirillum magnetotacticum MS-1]|uniref:Holo-[acyl-carrier-protein] synthase n=1 Tax=Paramagnetospirillum magnetotacticum MS-1 TaxID=272627 RepID=A0A0C2UB59_PARME|nr:holo-ACP synthase [Paramagnetospirillum magnetotacticum]KIL98727.1 Holo- acyl-carrier protein synthase [Paramagnetospirillum magnetotacticum MS-1]